MLTGLKTKVMGLIWPIELICPSSSKLAMLHIDLFLISKGKLDPTPLFNPPKLAIGYSPYHYSFKNSK